MVSQRVGAWTWRYLADIGEAPPVAVYVQHTLLDLARARLEAWLVHLLLGVVNQRGVGGGGGWSRGVRRPGQTRTSQDERQRDPLHPPASPSQLNSLGLRPCIGPLPHCKARHGTYMRVYTYINANTHTRTQEEGKRASEATPRKSAQDESD